MTEQTAGDIEIKCHCGKSFLFTVGEQEFFADRGFNPPKWCPDCRKRRKAERKNGRG